MKIIGKTDDGFLISAESKEVARLIGFYSDYDEKYRLLSIGDEIKINEMYEKLYEFESIRESIDEMREKLIQCSEVLKKVDPVLKLLGGSNCL